MRKLKDNILNFLLYTSSFITVGLLVLIVGFIFVNGIKLENIDATKYKCCQKENYSDIKVYDPIEKETCTYAALRARKYRNKTLYKNVIVMKQNLSGIGDA